MSIKLLVTKMTNYLFLTYELVIGNRRIIIPTMIGLILAITAISQSGVLVETYRQEIFEEVVFESIEDSYYADSDVIINIRQWQSKQLTESVDIGDYESYNSLINKSIDQANYSDYISNYYWYSQIDSYLWLNQTDGYYGYYPGKGMYRRNVPFFISSANELYTALDHILTISGKGRLPKDSSEIVMLRMKWDSDYYWYEEESKTFENVTLGTEVNITLSPEWEGGGSNKTMKIVGVIDYSPYESHTLDNTTLLLRKFFRSFWWDYSFITTPGFVQEIIEDLSQGLENGIGVETECLMTLDKTHFDAYNINSEIGKLQTFIRALEWQFQRAGYDSWIYSRILELMRQYETTVFGLLIILLLLSLPVICIALYLVVYSFGLIKRQKQEQIGIIKTRGGSWFQILIVLLGEMILSTVIAVILGFFLSTMLADVVMRSSNYLEFLGAPVVIRITVSMIQGLIIWGLIFALLLNFRNIIRMSRQEITETLEPVEIRNPFWKRYYLDVGMFVIGTATWVILMVLIRASYEGYEIYGTGLVIIYMILSLLGLPAPFLMFFGTIMVISRFFPILMKKLSEILWRIEGGINAFAIRNIVRHKQAANRAVLLITLALSFSILASSLIYSLDEMEHLKRYYHVGADLSIPTGNVLNITILQTLEQNVSHLSSISGVYSARFSSSGYFYRNTYFLFVNPDTYAKTAYVNPNFKLSSSLSSLMDEISDNNTIILYEGNLEADISKPKIGGNITLSFENDTRTEYLKFRIGGTFKYWPTMYPYPWQDPADNFWIIGSLGMFDRLNQSDYFNSPPEAVYQAKIDSLDNIDATVEEIYNVTGISPISPALDYREYKEGFGRRFSLSILNSDLIVCIVVATVGVIMFAFFTYVERGKEIGVERALGMTQLQTAQSFLVEAATILAFGSIIGYFTGAYFVTMFLQITQFGEAIPPAVVTHPTTLLLQIILGICAAAGIGTIIPAYLATRKDISRILKVE
ncbi:MAG: FtsX-like permease family protein [Candidatus Hodarchaeota archaeon]